MFDPVEVADRAFVEACEHIFGPLDRLVLACCKEGKVVESPELERAGNVVARYLPVDGIDNDATPQMDLVLYVRNATHIAPEHVTWKSYVSDVRDSQ